MKAATTLIVTLVAAVGLALSPTRAEAQTASTTAYREPFSGEYHTGILSRRGATWRLRGEDGKSHVLVLEASADIPGVYSTMVGNISAFVGAQITVRGLRYKVPSGTKTSEVLAIQSFAPGAEKNFVSGRLDNDANGVFLLTYGNRRIYLKGDFAKRLRPHAQTLKTSITMGDGVILYGKIGKNAAGRLELTESTQDLWMLSRIQPAPSPAPRTATASTEPVAEVPTATKSGITYRLFGIQTPATSRPAASGAYAYGHLELPADVDLKDNTVGSTRTFVKGRHVTTASRLAFPSAHRSIKFRGEEVARSISGGLSRQTTPQMKRQRVARKTSK